MSITIPTAISASAQTGFTDPVFTSVPDSAQSSHAKQNAVTALTSGTVPSGVTYHSVSSPFTFTIERPAQFRAVGQVNPVTGKLGSVPRNVYKIRTRKGVVPLAGQSPVTMVIETTVSVPAGADSADPDNIRAAFGVHGGAVVYSISAAVGDMLVNGVL